MITVITSITGGKDHVTNGQVRGTAKFVAYLDAPEECEWEVRPAYNRFTSPRRNSRVPKILTHQFVDTKYSLWIDGNLKLLKSPDELVETYLKDHDIAVFKHPTRDCIYDEATECAKRGLDNVETIIAQAVSYEKAGYAKHRGQAECGFILRRHTPKVEQFNNAWWAEHCVHSVRDQISFMYALDKVGLRCNIIDEQFKTYTESGKERWIRGDIVEIVPHLTPQPE
jgi:hypothetical protein